MQLTRISLAANLKLVTNLVWWNVLSHRSKSWWNICWNRFLLKRVYCQESPEIHQVRKVFVEKCRLSEIVEKSRSLGMVGALGEFSLPTTTDFATTCSRSWAQLDRPLLNTISNCPLVSNIAYHPFQLQLYNTKQISASKYCSVHFSLPTSSATTWALQDRPLTLSLPFTKVQHWQDDP